MTGKKTDNQHRQLLLLGGAVGLFLFFAIPLKLVPALMEMRDSQTTSTLPVPPVPPLQPLTISPPPLSWGYGYSDQIDDLRSDLESQIDDLESEIDSLEYEVSSLQSEIRSMERDISSMESDVDALCRESYRC